MLLTWKNGLNEKIIVVDESNEIGNNKLLYPNIAIISDSKIHLDLYGIIGEIPELMFFLMIHKIVQIILKIIQMVFIIFSNLITINITYDNANIVTLQLQFRYNIVYPSRSLFWYIWKWCRFKYNKHSN